MAVSLIDLSNAEVSCKPTPPQPTPTLAPEAATSQPVSAPQPLQTAISSGPSPYAGVDTDPEAVNWFVRNNPLAARRAMNLARGAATKRNGGLRIYRPGTCMYTSAANNPCLRHAGPQGFEFIIPGGEPGWEQTGIPPAISTRILVAVDGRSLLQSEQPHTISP
ncbi:MAG: hypothetical protein ACON4T_07560 [Synechococcus sp.]